MDKGAFMQDTILKDLLKEYEQKRIKANTDLSRAKEKLYSSCPKLQEIENSLNNLAIQTSKSILLNNQTNTLLELEEKIAILKKERSQILDSLGKSEDDLKPHYECAICKDSGYVINNYKTEMCNCLKQKIYNITYNKSNISNINKENFQTFNFNVYSDTIDEKKYNSNISPRENIKLILDIAKKFIVNFDNPNEKNLLFTGNTGLGKTFLSNCIAKTIMEKGKIVLYQTAPIMLDTIIDYRFGKNKSSDIYESILDADLLIIDDLGTETINNLKFTELFNIINTRLLNQEKKITKTIISTNLSLQNLFSLYDERIVSRIVGYYNICRFFGDDIRFQLK